MTTTVALLAKWGDQPPDTLYSTDEATAGAMVAAKQATTNLAGAVAWVRPGGATTSPGLALVPVTGNLTLRPEHNGAVLVVTSAVPVCITRPRSLGARFNCGVIVQGAGSVTVLGRGGVTIYPTGSIVCADDGTTVVAGSLSVTTAPVLLDTYGATIFIPGLADVPGFADAKTWRDEAGSTRAQIGLPVRRIDAVTGSAPVATRSSDTNAPTLVAAGPNYVLNFPNTPTVDSSMGFAGAPVASQSSFWMILVCKPSVSSSSRMGFSLHGAGQARIRLGTNATTGNARCELRDDAGTTANLNGDGGAAPNLHATNCVIGLKRQITNVGTGAGTAYLRANGAEVKNGAVVLAAASLTLGSISTSDTTANFFGDIYAVATGPGFPTDAEMLIMERHLALLAGVVIA